MNESTTPLADALAEVDQAQNVPGSLYAEAHELQALRNLAEAVRTELLARDRERPPARSLTVLTTNFELLRILDGHELTFRAETGELVQIRLCNVDELLASHQRACAETGTEPQMSRKEAVNLCRPIGKAGLR